jgi:DnaJ-class molecular chaperone
MMDDICHHCDGSGESDFLSGSRCHECNGTGWIDRGDDPELTDEEQEEYEREMDAFYSDERQS